MLKDRSARFGIARRTVPDQDQSCIRITVLRHSQWLAHQRPGCKPAMTRNKFLKGECQHCGGHLEFPAESIGLAATCPRCGRETELMLATPPVEPTVPRRVILWTAVTVVMLMAGLVVLLAGLRHFERQAARQRPKSSAAPHQETNATGQAAPNAGAP